jgi:hypothetical protein
MAVTETMDVDDVLNLKCDAVNHMSLAEKPDIIIEWLRILPAPTDAETKAGRRCAPALRDALLTRSLIYLCAVENLRDANVLLQAFLAKLETRDVKELTVSLINKKDGKAPSHAIFGCMLVRICEKDTRTGPLFS